MSEGLTPTQSSGESLVQTRPRATEAGALMFLLLALGILLIQAHLPQWRGHLEVDIKIYSIRSWPFIDEGTWKHLEFSEYPPAALWFFVLMHWVTLNPLSYPFFLNAMIWLNVLLIVAQFFFFKLYGPRGATIIFVATVLAMGPILLFRFELFVTMLLLVAWELFRRDRLGASAFLLGLAACMKLYPVVLLPLLLMDLFRRKQILQIYRTIMFFLAGLLAPTVAFLAWGGSLVAITNGLRMQQLRTVALEGIWGTLITLLQFAMGIPRRVVDMNNERGLISDLWFLPNGVVSFAEMALIILLFIWMFRLPKERRLSEPAFAFLTLFVFTFFAKHENPQYRWWFAAFLPFLAVRIYPRSLWVVVALVIGLFLTQFIYPLHYNEFLDWFYDKQASPRLFLISVVRNVVFLFAVILTFVDQVFCAQSKFAPTSR